MINLIFSGDFAPISKVEILTNHEMESAFLGIRKLLENVNLHITNLECPLTNYSKSIDKTGPVLKATRESINSLKVANVKIACLANNHIRDYNDQGILDTIEICTQNGIDTIGAGENYEAAKKILYKNINNTNIAFINYCEAEFSIADLEHAGANPIDQIQIFYDIQKAKKEAEFVFVIIHCGHEYYSYPTSRIKKLFHYCADLGASAVIGHHSHVIGGYEIYNGVPLLYSLGNFVFYDNEMSNENWQLGLLAELRLLSNKRIELEIHPIKQVYDPYSIELIEESEKKEILNRISQISNKINDDLKIEKEWISFASKNNEHKFRAIYGFSTFQKIAIKIGIPQHFFIKKNRLLWLLNMFRNESHRELLTNILKRKYKDANWNS